VRKKDNIMGKDVGPERFIPKARGYTFEIIIFFIEMGKRYLILSELMVTYVLYKLLSLNNLLLYFPLLLVPPLLFFSIFIVYLWVSSRINNVLNLSNKLANNMSWIRDGKTIGIDFSKTKAGLNLAKQYDKYKIPIETFIESYLNEEIDILNNKTLEIFFNRYDLFTFIFTIGHLKWFLFTFLSQVTGHSIKADHREVGDVYNRGNDFYNWFLGKSMVYTSAIFHDQKYKSETLEKGQANKLESVCKTVQMKPGMQHLDIGCGWGTLVVYAAKNFGTYSTGCTLAKEQVAYAKTTVNGDNKWFLGKSDDVSDKVSWIIDDYRNISKHDGNKKYDVITCVEMAEHVGIKNFQPFLSQVKNMLKDDGLFYIQMAGVRRTWSYEDIIWILFMGKYIFPGADASTPINWVIQELERAGFEIHRLESLGCHYARTIQLWHENWINNKDNVINKYGKRWFRLWDIFLAWSCIIANQGTSNVYMITCNKNSFCDISSIQTKYNKTQNIPKLNRSKKFIGPDLISYQQ